MSDDPKASRSNRRPVLIVVGVLVVYLFSYFPAMSFIVRHPQLQRAAAPWRPMPNAARLAMSRPDRSSTEPAFRSWTRKLPRIPENDSRPGGSHHLTHETPMARVELRDLPCV
ncbi:MAG TPA: hypothetical protein VGO11_05140, partial [Chthoniobacteraceae bacterium]|nr:hypothetical protein [Chthoniobacteraceae bacterium]